MAPTQEKAGRGFIEADRKYRHHADLANTLSFQRGPLKDYRYHVKWAKRWKRRALICALVHMGEGMSKVRRLLKMNDADENWLNKA